MTRVEAGAGWSPWRHATLKLVLAARRARRRPRAARATSWPRRWCCGSEARRCGRRGAPRARRPGPRPGAAGSRARRSAAAWRCAASRRRRRAGPAVAELGMHAAHDAAADRRRSVVFLETAPQARSRRRPPAARRSTSATRRSCRTCSRSPSGSTVDFPNSDRTYHNVFSLSKARRFDLGRYPRGQSRSVRFDRPGVVRVFCEIHSHMSAWILVFAHRYFATTDAEGRYRIEGVPPGTYTLAAWNDGAVRARTERAGRRGGRGRGGPRGRVRR